MLISSFVSRELSSARLWDSCLLYDPCALRYRALSVRSYREGNVVIDWRSFVECGRIPDKWQLLQII